MRFAIVSDIHANLPAWKAVLTDIASNRVDRILCLGDTVGYGPQPLEVLSSLHQHVDAFCMGNHDAACCGKLPTERFNPLAVTLIDWTRGKLTPRATDFLSAFPLVLTAPGFRCSHGDFSDPSAFNYVISPPDALPSWQTVPEPLLFVGHSHVPAIHLIGHSRHPHLIPAQDFVLEPGKRYIVNPGSVGHPRDGDLRASYAIHDTDTGTVTFRRIPFDIDLYLAALNDANLPVDQAVFSHDPLAALTPLREDQFFAPAQTSATPRATNVTPAAEISRYKRATRLWQKTALLATLAAFAALLLAALAIKFSPRAPAPADALSITIPATPLAIFTPAPGAPNLLPPIPDHTDRALPGWRCLFNSTAQHVSTRYAHPANHILLHAPPGDPQPFRIESPPIKLPSGLQRATLRAQLQPGQNFNGTLSFILEELGDPSPDGTHPVLRRDHKTPSRRGNATLLATQFTTPKKFLTATRFLRLTIEGQTAGDATFTLLSLTPAAMPQSKGKRNDE